MSLEARLDWRSPLATHADRLLVPESALQADGRWLAAGAALREMAEVHLDAAPWCQPSGQAMLELAAGSFQPRTALVAGRFYPRLAFGGALGTARDLRPVRVLEACSGSAGWRIDPNHPLAGLGARLVLRHSPLDAAPGQRLADLFDGPGMQLAAAGMTADGFERGDPTDDAMFYAIPRLTWHMDANCRAAVADFYGRLLQPGMRVLDLMASWDSHLGVAPAGLAVSGLGMNRDELEANPRLSERVVQDLNTRPTLAWPDSHFDCVVCTASIEYLVRPDAVIAEVKRVLRPGGVFAASFSDRWFPTKAIRAWGELHPFERIGLVLGLFARAGFEELHTESLRGVLRPADDRYIAQRRFSDPLFAVCGRRSGLTPP